MEIEMRKIGKFIVTAGVLLFAFVFLTQMPARAEIKVMNDGGMFDPQYYAAANPDVVMVLGNSEDALYNHYKSYGRAEGRLPYIEQNTPPTAPNEAAAAFVIPANIINQCSNPNVYGTVLNSYLALPEKLRNHYEKNKIKIYCLDGNRTHSADNRNTVRIYNNQVNNYREGLYHELGHEFDFIQRKKTGRFLSELDPFPMELYPALAQAAVRETREEIPNGYRIWRLETEIYSADEVIAVIAQCFFTDPVKLQNTCPYAFAYAVKYFGPYIQ